jgi:hypothetical protein
MHVFETSTAELSSWIRAEVELEREVSAGNRGNAVRRVQEWLNLHGFGIAIDEAFGPVTERAVSQFQTHSGLAATGVVDATTYAAMVAPMTQVLRQRLNMSVGTGDAVLDYARAHLAVHPREVGGQNRGPWVRLYMLGSEGEAFPWCAGFVTFLIEQACQSMLIDKPIAGSGSCDSLAAQAKAAGRFLPESQVVAANLPAGSIFLVRRTDTDWTHTGLVTGGDGVAFDTIEGNTNDDGVREGFEVCARSRGYAGKDFILLS